MIKHNINYDKLNEKQMIKKITRKCSSILEPWGMYYLNCHQKGIFYLIIRINIILRI